MDAFLIRDQCAHWPDMIFSQPLGYRNSTEQGAADTGHGWRFKTIRIN